MAQSRLGAKDDGGIGERGGDLGAWNKLQLGWLDYETVVADAEPNAATSVRRSTTPTSRRRVVVVLPKKAVTTEFGAPSPGHQAVVQRQRRRPRQHADPAGRPPGADAASLTFQARYDIEDCGPTTCDYAYVEVDTGTGSTARSPGSDHRDAAEGNRHRRHARRPAGPAYVRPVGVRRHDGRPAVPLLTDADGRRQRSGPSERLLRRRHRDHRGGATVFTDGAESGANGWTLRRLHRRRAPASTSEFDNYYIAGYRSYVSYDQYLKTGPYYFGYPNTKPDFVDHYAYQQGLLISYWDTSYSDNDTFAHPGSGRNLYIDAHPRPMLPARRRCRGGPGSRSTTRRSVSRKADSFTLHINGQPSYIRGQAAQPLFDDTKQVLVRRAAQPRRQAARGRREDPRARGERHLGQDPDLLTP